MIHLIIAEIITTAVVSFVFVILYGLRSSWKESAVGQHLMWFGIVTGVESVALTLLACGISLPLWMFALIYGTVLGVSIQRLYLLLQAQRRSRL
jgi:hypothetical protein